MHIMTFQGGQSGMNEEYEITELFVTFAGEAVKNLLCLDEWPKAARENLDFETGFFALSRWLLEIYMCA